MSDFIIILWLSTMMWVNVTVLEQQHTTAEQIVALQETNSFLWAEGENVTARLKACEKKKGKK